MPKNNVHLPDSALTLPKTHGFQDDFINMSVLAPTGVSADGAWTLTADSGSSSTVTQDEAGGEIQIGNADNTNHDGALLHTTAKIFKFAAGKALTMICRAKYTEASTNAANLFIGLSDTVSVGTDGLLRDDGAGPATTFDGVGFYKVDSTTNTDWNVVTSNAAVQTKTQTDVAAVGATGYHTFRIDVRPTSSTLADVIFSVDTSGGNDFAQCRENGANPRTPNIKHSLSLSGLEEMHVVMGRKNGATAIEVLTVDYVSCYQTR